jgi:dGTPase
MNHSYAPFATLLESSRGRFVKEPDDGIRTPFQRDRDRIIHAHAFRRLKHKTQVFVAVHGDHYRTRLTHSLEVAQIARTLARALGCNEDLAETLALAHDLGHPPFGHAGEDALNEALAAYGGFDHNAHTLRVVWWLEGHYPSFYGLNLTWETLEGLVKHNGSITNPHPVIEEVNSIFPLDLQEKSGLEAQLAALADDIAYCCHDIDDGLRAGILNLPHITQLPLLEPIFTKVKNQLHQLDDKQYLFTAMRQLMHFLITDLINTTRQRLENSGIKNAIDIRQHPQTMASFSVETWQNILDLKKYMMAHFYKHPSVNTLTIKASNQLKALTKHLLFYPECLPLEWQNRHDGSKPQIASVIRDYVAGMTDRYAIDSYRRLIGDSWS